MIDRALRYQLDLLGEVAGVEAALGVLGVLGVPDPFALVFAPGMAAESLRTAYAMDCPAELDGGARADRAAGQ